MDTKQHDYKVLMLPWLAHGHISPYLELAKKLSQKNFSIYLCSTPINLSSIKPKLANYEKHNINIQLIDLHLPSSPNLPPHLHTTKGLPPHLHPTLQQTFAKSAPTFSNILQNLKPNLIISDPMQPWVPPLASLHNIPLVVFPVTSVTACSFSFHLQKHGFKGSTPYPFPEIYIADPDIKRMLRVLETWGSGFGDTSCVNECIQASGDIVLFKSSREVDGKYIDYLSALTNKKILPVGLLLEDNGEEDKGNNATILEWLNKKPESSTVFVSFGSECYLKKEELEDIALGLEQSSVNFIWVIRFPEGQQKISIEEALPQGFIGRVRERGLIVEGWAPQTQILRHPNIGGFASHCGLSSLMESIGFGVPLIAMPMQYDQPINGRLAVEIGVGLEVLTDENGYFKREEVAKVIEKVVVGKSGGEFRRKARELSERIKSREDDEMNCVIKELEKIM